MARAPEPSRTASRRPRTGAGPPPYVVLRRSALSPVCLTCEHAAAKLPFPAPRGAAGTLLRTHWGVDIGAWALTRELSRRLEAGAIGGRWSRLYIDLNRRVDDPTLVRRSAGGVRLPWNTHLGPAEIERRVLAVHVPYHTEFDRLILRRLVRGVRPLLVAVHTFTPDFEDEDRGFDLGVLYRDHETLARRLGRAARRGGLSVRYNRPYSGIGGMMYAVDRHGSHHGLPCIELEANQRLFERPHAAARLAAVLAPPLSDLARAGL